MYIINKERGNGKTYELIKDSYKMQIPILCFSKQNAKFIKDKANRELGLEILEPICIDDLESLHGLDIKEVLIDELDYCLSSLIGYKVAGATLSGQILNKI